MNEGAERLLREIENRGRFISAAHEVERLRDMVEDFKKQTAMLMYHIGRFQGELQREYGMTLDDLKWAAETERQIDPGDPTT